MSRPNASLVLRISHARSPSCSPNAPICLAASARSEERSCTRRLPGTLIPRIVLPDRDAPRAMPPASPAAPMSAAPLASSGPLAAPLTILPASPLAPAKRWRASSTPRCPFRDARDPPDRLAPAGAERDGDFRDGAFRLEAFAPTLAAAPRAETGLPFEALALVRLAPRSPLARRRALEGPGCLPAAAAREASRISLPPPRSVSLPSELPGRPVNQACTDTAQPSLRRAQRRRGRRDIC